MVSKRVTVSLDLDTARMAEELAGSESLSVSATIRRCIRAFYRVAQKEGRIESLTDQRHSDALAVRCPVGVPKPVY